MIRTVYYTTYVSHEEYQNGAMPHYSKPFNTLEEARTFEKTLGDMNTKIELHHEIFERNEWLPDWDMGNSWCEVIDD